MSLYQGKYGVITQPDESTYIIGNYQVVASGGLWVLSSVITPNNKTWLTGSAAFDNVQDAIRVAVIFGKEDSLADGLREMFHLFVDIEKKGMKP